jgi:hypothetical protein
MVFSAFNKRALFALTAGVFVASAASLVSAAEPNTYTIAAAPGYGVEDCLAEGGECGHAVADAWCESQGRGAAVKFGRSEQSLTAEGGPYFITCGD